MSKKVDAHALPFRLSFSSGFPKLLVSRRRREAKAVLGSTMNALS